VAAKRETAGQTRPIARSWRGLGEREARKRRLVVARALLSRAAVYSSILRAGAIVLLAALGCSPAAKHELTRRPVLSTTHRTTTTLVVLRTESEKLVTTPEHPFAAGERWTRAADLEVGDMIQTASGSTRVLGIQRRHVPPTDVYNLSIAKTHSYFAGQSALLVHNVDCGPSKTLAELFAEERYAEQLERELRERREQRLLDRQRRQQNRLSLNDVPEPHKTPNCAMCAVAALSDSKTVSEFLRKYSVPDQHLDNFKPLSDKELQQLLRRIGLSRPESGASLVFRRPVLRHQFSAMIKRGTHRKDIDLDTAGLGELPAALATKHLESLPGNTSMLIYRWVESIETPPGSGKFTVTMGSHAVAAVRSPSGRIMYVDTQDVPPKVYLNLPKTTFETVVMPTDVDWRYNRQLYAALRDGKYESSL
jgi:hypothetical protein